MNKNFYEREKKNRPGFTLIELLVVISIIGFLATASMVVFNSVRIKARNSKRNQDIKQLITALGLAADDAGGVIPVGAGGNWTCISSTCYAGWVSYGANASLDAAIAPYIKKPVDPPGSGRATGGYLYIGQGGNYGQGAGAYLHWEAEAPINCDAGFVYSGNYCMAKVAF